jgi:hypothetical protein
MKTKHTLLLAGLASAFLITHAEAGNVYIVGAQAVRTSINPAVSSIPGIRIVATSGATTNAADVNNAVFNLWQLNTGEFVAVNYNGGEAAVSALLSTNDTFSKVPFLSTNQTGSITNTNAITDLQRPQIAVANTGKISRFYGTTVNQLINGVLTALKYDEPSDDSAISVSTYGFAADQSFTNTGVTSITAAQARVLFANGHIPLSYLTGKASDSNATVWLIGRNIDAGARVVVYNEVGAGALSDTHNYKAVSTVTNSGVKTISSLALTPPTIVGGIPQLPGNDGEAQGSTLIKNLLPVVSGSNLSVVDAIVTYATNPVTNSVVVTNNELRTNPVVTTNVTQAYQRSVVNVPVVTTNYTYTTNWTWNQTETNTRIYVTYNRAWTNKPAVRTDVLTGYTFANKLGKFTEPTLVAPHTTAVTSITNSKGVVTTQTNNVPARFAVNEYYTGSTWEQVPTVSTNTNRITNTVFQTNFTLANITNFSTNYEVSTVQVTVTNQDVANVLIPVATNYTTNTWTKSGPNYLLTYDSLVNITSAKNTNANGLQPILLSYNGVGGNGAVASTNNPSVAGITNQVANGSYTLWNYDRLLLNAEGTNNPAALGVRDAIKNSLSASVTFPNLKTGDLNVTSPGDGATPWPKAD